MSVLHDCCLRVPCCTTTVNLPLTVCCVTCHASCYKFRVVAFCPWSNRIEHMEVTDPYSRCTTANGERTLLVDLEDPELMPAGWKDHTAPKVASWHDISVYELHIRDFRWGQEAGLRCAQGWRSGLGTAMVAQESLAVGVSTLGRAYVLS